MPLAQVDVTNYPSIMAERPSPKTSRERYGFVHTLELVDMMKAAGWYPVKVMEQKATALDKLGYQKHAIYFRSEASLMSAIEVGALYHEIGIVNAHTGDTVAEFFQRILRAICTNGATVIDQTCQSYKIRHTAYADSMARDAISRMVTAAPLLENKVKRFTEIEMTPNEQRTWVMKAAEVKYGIDTMFPIWNGIEDAEEQMNTAIGQGKAIIDLDLLREPVRVEDRSYAGNGDSNNSLWHVFNIAQEKLVEKGGRFKSTAGKINLPMARPITSIDENLRVNKGLWQLADSYATQSS